MHRNVVYYMSNGKDVDRTLTASDEPAAQLIDQVAARLRDWGLAAPGIAFLEANKPFSFLGSQFLLFLQPLLSTLIQPALTNDFIALLADRANVEKLIDKLESNGEAHPR
jgi:hypothetical protein